MSKASYFFINGPLDGERRAFPSPLKEVTIPEIVPGGVVWHEEDEPFIEIDEDGEASHVEPVTYRHHRYKRCGRLMVYAGYTEETTRERITL